MPLLYIDLEAHTLRQLCSACNERRVLSLDDLMLGDALPGDDTGPPDVIRLPACSCGATEFLLCTRDTFSWDGNPEHEQFAQHRDAVNTVAALLHGMGRIHPVTKAALEQLPPPPDRLPEELRQLRLAPPAGPWVERKLGDVQLLLEEATSARELERVQQALVEHQTRLATAEAEAADATAKLDGAQTRLTEAAAAVDQARTRLDGVRAQAQEAGRAASEAASIARMAVILAPEKADTWTAEAANQAATAAEADAVVAAVEQELAVVEQTATDAAAEVQRFEVTIAAAVETQTLVQLAELTVEVVTAKHTALAEAVSQIELSSEDLQDLEPLTRTWSELPLPRSAVMSATAPPAG